MYHLLKFRLPKENLANLEEPHASAARSQDLLPKDGDLQKVPDNNSGSDIPTQPDNDGGPDQNHQAARHNMSIC
ncbi:hypothetical protein ABW19_dt0203190 [Dactylella cylindrospora]|nr:hypothetical protein ABW19_dt0203190 [Dactylella cylindrospora]